MTRPVHVFLLGVCSISFVKRLELFLKNWYT